MFYRLTASLCRFLLLALIAVGMPVMAQEVGAPEAPNIVADKFNRGTPNGAAQGFLAAVDIGDYETAAEYLDLRNLRGEATELTGPQLARRLFVIIQRATWLDVDDLVNDPNGREGDGLPDYRDSIGKVLNKDKEVQLLMQRVPRGDGESIWKVSNATVSRIPELYAIYGYSPAVEKLRRSLPEVSFLGFELFKWVIVLATAIVVYLIVFLVALLMRRQLGEPNKPAHRQVFRFLVLPFGLWAVLIAMNTAATSLGRGVTAEALQQYSPLPVLITVWMLFAGIGLIGTLYGSSLERDGRLGGLVLIRPVSNAIRLLIFLSAILVYLDRIGINITSVLAGLGVGGIAVALALQKPMEDVFGAITLYTQQPVRVGDFCSFGDITGTIEEIGLRTTYLRTLANTRIAIPNGRLAGQPIDNISARQKILYRPSLRLRYDSSPRQIRAVLDGIRELLEKDERILDGHRVRFNEIGDDALKLEIFAYFDTQDWAEYLQLAEDMNLRVLDIVTAAGTSLALPASTLRIEQVSDTAPALGADRDKSA